MLQHLGRVAVDLEPGRVLDRHRDAPGDLLTGEHIAVGVGRRGIVAAEAQDTGGLAPAPQRHAHDRAQPELPAQVELPDGQQAVPEPVGVLAVHGHRGALVEGPSDRGARGRRLRGPAVGPQRLVAIRIGVRDRHELQPGLGCREPQRGEVGELRQQHTGDRLEPLLDVELDRQELPDACQHLEPHPGVALTRLGPQPLQELPHLGAEGGHLPDELVVGLLDLAAVELHDGEHLAARPQRDRERAAQPVGERRPAPGEVVGPLEVGEPHRFPGRPDATGHADARCQPELVARGLERGDAGVGSVPQVDAAEVAAGRRRRPQRRDGPVERLADPRQQRLADLLERRRLGQDPGDGELRLEPALGPLALGDVDGDAHHAAECAVVVEDG